jgi:hypothetical protein
LAASFFVTALTAANQQPNNLANAVWIVGAIIMDVVSLIRLPPRVVIIDVRSIAATPGMLVLSCVMRPTTPSVGLLAVGGIVLELTGATATQVARIHMGQHFGLLPANRGIVTRVLSHSCAIRFTWAGSRCAPAMPFRFRVRGTPC